MKKSSYKPITIQQVVDDISNGKPWQIPLFNFVDDFRLYKDIEQIQEPLCHHDFQKTKEYALITASVMSLCDELTILSPQWTKKIVILNDPWFVAGIVSLRPMALIESPLYFRMRNIFVFKNFLNRA